MKRSISSLCLLLALFVLMPDLAWSQAYNQTQSPPTPTPTPRNGRRGRNPSPTPAGAPAAPIVAATPAPTPTPPSAAVISALAPGFVTVTQGAATKSYKVTRYSQITYDGQTDPFAALKVGMGVVITPTSDLVYADSVAATDPPPPPPAPVAAAPAAPMGEAAPAAAAPAPAGSPAPAPVSPPVTVPTQ